MPSPRKGESQSSFISRCMSSDESQNSFPDQKQRSAFCHSQWKNKSKSDEDAGYPPNCKPGYVEKDGKCVPKATSSEYKCPYDSLDTRWTGETKVLLSKTFYVMRCINGHETLSDTPR